MNIFFEVVGWLGTILIVCAYYLVSSKKIKPTSKNYQLLNFFGALGISINVWHHKAWPSFALQIVWGSIAVVSLIKIIVYKKNRSQ